ncbi:MAG TPA: hypothetical protein VK650_10575, partial [Steroidobacteraceae bacterium]|nr:hypothetical protein [Steroidobacteraceae bacterium]
MSNRIAPASAAAILLASLCLPAHAQQPVPQGYDAHLMREVDDYRRTHERMILAELDALTRLRSIAADPAGLAAAAQALQELLRARGFESTQLRDAPGTPAVVF